MRRGGGLHILSWETSKLVRTDQMEQNLAFSYAAIGTCAVTSSFRFIQKLVWNSVCVKDSRKMLPRNHLATQKMSRTKKFQGEQISHRGFCCILELQGKIASMKNIRRAKQFY